MKAYYDFSSFDRDFYIHLTSQEIIDLLQGTILTCDLYSLKEAQVFFNKGKLELLVVPDERALYEKYQESKRKIVDFQEVLLEWGNKDGSIPYKLTLERNWCKESLTLDRFKRCGGSVVRYGGGNNICFYSDAGHKSDKSHELIFLAVENKWRGEFEKPE